MKVLYHYFKKCCLFSRVTELEQWTLLSITIFLGIIILWLHLNTANDHTGHLIGQPLFIFFPFHLSKSSRRVRSGRMSGLVSLEAAVAGPADWKRPFESWLVHCWGQLGLLFLAFPLGAMGTQYDEIRLHPPSAPSAPHASAAALTVTPLLSESRKRKQAVWKWEQCLCIYLTQLFKSNYFYCAEFVPVV